MRLRWKQSRTTSARATTLLSCTRRCGAQQQLARYQGISGAVLCVQQRHEAHRAAVSRYPAIEHWPSMLQCSAQISACDSILAGMESMLGGFQVSGAVCNSAGVLVAVHAVRASGDGIVTVACLANKRMRCSLSSIRTGWAPSVPRSGACSSSLPPCRCSSTTARQLRWAAGPRIEPPAALLLPQADVRSDRSDCTLLSLTSMEHKREDISLDCRRGVWQTSSTTLSFRARSSTALCRAP